MTVVLSAAVSCDPPTPLDNEVRVREHTTPMIGVIPNGNDRFWKAAEWGALQSAEKNGFLLNWAELPSPITAQQQKAVIDRMINERVDGIVIAPHDFFFLQESVKKAQNAGIPVLYFGLSLSLEGKNTPSVVATDQFAAGRLAAIEMANQLGEKGRVVIIRHNPLLRSTCDREEGFLEQIKNYPDMEVIDDEVYAGSNEHLAREKIENVFHFRFRHGNAKVDGLFVSEESNARETLQFLRANREFADNVFVAFGSSAELINSLQTYYVNALVMEQPAIIGKKAIDSMARLFYDETLAPLNDSGVFVLTLENFDAPYAKALINLNTLDEITPPLLQPPQNEDEEEKNENFETAEILEYFEHDTVAR